jgi:predicted nicotinamide N-methyase
MADSYNTALDRPSELSLTDYIDLLQQIESLDAADQQSEFLDAARYNDMDVVRGLLRVAHDTCVNHQDAASLNTALHMSAANGHVNIVALLLAHGANPALQNRAGNTPLHWAATNQQTAAVQLLLQHETADVLTRNQFGRSALTEGFASENTDIVQCLLEHASATEERLLSGGDDGTTCNNTDTMETTNDASITHHMIFGNAIAVQVREQAMATSEKDSILGQERPQDDTTGLGIWAASLVCAQWMASRSLSIPQQQSGSFIILELGAGCGVPSIVLASKYPSAKLYATDFNPTTVDNLTSNLKPFAPQATALMMNWNDRSTWPTENIDFLVGSDLIYQSDVVPLLTRTIRALLHETGTFAYVAPESGRQGQDEFFVDMQQDFNVQTTVAPKEYRANTLASGDDDECFVHFHELSSTTFLLHEFTWKQQ